jgi:Leucine-rich repeat (LRR) protein
VNGLPAAGSSPVPRLRVPILAKLAAALWIAQALFGAYWAISSQFAVLSVGHARDDTPIPLEIFLLGALTIYSSVRTWRGRQRSLLLAVGIASCFAALVAPTLMTTYHPSELWIWWLSSLVGVPVTPRINFDPAGRLVWFIVGDSVLAADFALVARPAYLRFRRERPQGTGGLWPALVTFLLLLAPFAILTLFLTVESARYAQRFPDVIQARLNAFREAQHPESIQSLDLNFAPLEPADLQRLKSFTALTRLIVTGARITDAGLKEIADLSSLEALNLGYTPVTDHGLKELKRPPHLHELSLAEALTGTEGVVSDSGLKEIAQIPQLTKLDLSGIRSFGVEGIRALRKLDKLPDLNLWLTNAQDSWIKDLAELKNLTSLNIEQNMITDAGLKGLDGFHNLTVLTLSRTRVTDAGMKDVARLATLTKLSVSETKIGDAGVKELSRLNRLTDIDLVATDVTDTAVADLIRLPELTNLCLINTQITDAGLTQLGRLPRLQRLEVGGTHVTEKGAEKFKQAHPQVKVTWFFH